jgi:signal transduction histidine kinase
MSKVHLRFATDILRRFGEELNPNPDQGILELVKNAYDADARHCTVELTAIGEPGGTIRVSDDGDGMEEGDIEEGWLVLGRSPKSSIMTTRLGRIPAGNKGLGRLAALRMGQTTSLLTYPRNDAQREYQISIDWAKFDAADVVEEVTLNLVSRSRVNQLHHGTVITITDIRLPLTRADVKRLARGVLLLADPFGDDVVGFHPVLKAEEFKDLEKLVQGKYFNDAEFHLTVTVDETGHANAIVTDYRGQELFRAQHNELGQESVYGCPPAQFDLWVFILSSQTFSARTTSIEEVRTWLREFGGVHLYLNGLRVAPYGNPGNDWLDMNLRRVKNPELRPGTNTSIGRFSVTDLENTLRQKTDRSGIVEGDAFSELKRVAQDALEWMARERLRAREIRRTKERAEAPKHVDQAKDNLSTAIESLPTKTRAKVQKHFEQYERVREKEAQTLRREVQLYRTLGTAGITASVFAHESRNPIRLIIHNAKLLIRRAKETLIKKKYTDSLEQPLERVLRQGETLRSFTNLTLSLVDNDKRRIGRVEVHTRIKDVLHAFESLAKERKVDVIPKFAAGNPYFRGSDAAFESILTNLIVNSMKAFESVPPGPRTLAISTELVGENVALHVADNGPGIQGISLRNIWLPGETTYPNGTGLGLTIVHDTVRDLGGSVDVLSNGSLGGAEFVVEIPILGA